ncbi:hypothetical protein [Nodosilinea sp. LEGE 07088]|nr:hypothetical protein [Nodosilinea sp. LEGE 07088]
MVFLPFLTGAAIVALALVAGVSFMTWLFPVSPPDADHKRQP